MFAYNHKKSEWKEVAAMKTPRSMFGAVIHKGKIIVAGGVNEEGLIGTCEAYDFGTNKYVAFMIVHQYTAIYKVYFFLLLYLDIINVLL